MSPSRTRRSPRRSGEATGAAIFRQGGRRGGADNQAGPTPDERALVVSWCQEFLTGPHVTRRAANRWRVDPGLLGAMSYPLTTRLTGKGDEEGEELDGWSGDPSHPLERPRASGAARGHGRGRNTRAPEGGPPRLPGIDSGPRRGLVVDSAPLAGPPAHTRDRADNDSSAQTGDSIALAERQ